MIDIDKILKLAGLFEDDRDHDRTLARTGFWGEQAGGCLFFAQSTGKFLIGYRSGSVLQPHTWGTFGGAIDKGEQPDAAVLREAEEEVGYHGPVKLIPIFVFKKETFRYYNFIAVVPEEFEPRLNWENDDTAWVEFGQWPTPLHFGMNGILGDPASVATMKKLAKLPDVPLQNEDDSKTDDDLEKLKDILKKFGITDGMIISGMALTSRSRREIAKRLGITIEAVDQMVSSLQSKLKLSRKRPAVEESAMRSLINICEWPSEPKMKAGPEHNYTITRAVNGGWVLMYNGHELQHVETTKEAAIMAARDMVSGYPEVTPDLMYDMLDEFDGNIHDPGFMPALISVLERDFNKQVRPKLSLVPPSKE